MPFDNALELMAASDRSPKIREPQFIEGPIVRVAHHFHSGVPSGGTTLDEARTQLTRAGWHDDMLCLCVPESVQARINDCHEPLPFFKPGTPNKPTDVTVFHCVIYAWCADRGLLDE